jgi:hypothetical protein
MNATLSASGIRRVHSTNVTVPNSANPSREPKVPRLERDVDPVDAQTDALRQSPVRVGRQMEIRTPVVGEAARPALG